MADSSGHDEDDIRELEPEDAKKYIIAVMATLKQTTAKRIQLERDLELWEKRVNLALENGRQELIEGAQRRVTQIQEDLGRLRAEEHEYSEGLSRMRSQLRMIEAQPKLSVDVDLLTAQMDMMLGEEEKAESETKEKFREAEADIALEELKKRMQDDGE